jgi:3-dehydrotetronate 4-kinase
MSLIFGAIADDLTGGLELAAMLRAQGVACDFVTDSSLISANSHFEAAVVALRTRVAPVARAVAAFKDAGARLLAAGTPRLFFKYCATFDSTDEGNIGPCADSLSDLTNAQQILFCPSFPEAGRRVFQGHLFVDAQLISESPKRDDPLTPMHDPNLVRVLQRQTATRVGLLPHQTVQAGRSAMQDWSEATRRRGIRYAIADAASPADLRALAEFTADWPLMTGNSSIAAYYPACWREKGLVGGQRSSTAITPVPGPGVVLAGSCAERTLQQLDSFAQSRPVLRLDLVAAASGAEGAIDQAVAWAAARVMEGPVAIATSASPQKVQEAQKALGQRRAADLAEALLGRIAQRLRLEAGVTRYLVAGGETSGAVLEHLDVRRLRVGPYEAPGLAQAVHEDPSPLAFCLKSGKLGPEDMFLPMLDKMSRGVDVSDHLRK